MNIISASRRTDIPAFYSEWFMGRVREGRVRYANPFGGQVYEVSLRPEDIHSIVFWSKNFQPLEPHLPGLEAMGYDFIFHFTLTGLPKPFEGYVPPWQEAVQSFLRLSDRYGPKRVLWRFDPIIFSNITGPDYFKRSFETLARRLERATERCYFSFVSLYPKVRLNLQRLAFGRGDPAGRPYNPSYPEKLSLVKEMVGIAHSHGITLYACCDEALAISGVRPARCVDGELLSELFPHKPKQSKVTPTRKGCHCTQSRDIGAYDTCPHGCVYCYANLNHELAQSRFEAHDPSADMLLPVRSAECGLRSNNSAYNRK
jgi:hypothetical protein